jgi:hypothetical protein
VEERLSDPVPPRNVRLVLPGGIEQPVETAYVGFDAVKGLHLWTVVDDLSGWIVPGARLEVRVDSLPPHTSLRFGEVEWDDD